MSAMKTIRLYDWEDEGKQHLLKEVAVRQADDYTRGGKKRLFVWSGEGEEFNYVLYPDDGTAYPEFDTRLQQQRLARRYRYDAVD